jgi:hypothetical protein
MRLHSRLRRLEQAAPDPGCLACYQRRGRIVFVRARALRDGTVLADGEPTPCNQCGRVAEMVIEVVEPLAGEDEG